MSGKELHYLLQTIDSVEGRVKTITKDMAEITYPDAADREKLQFLEGTVNGMQIAIDSFRRALSVLNQ